MKIIKTESIIHSMKSYYLLSLEPLYLLAFDCLFTFITRHSSTLHPVRFGWGTEETKEDRTEG